MITTNNIETEKTKNSKISKVDFKNLEFGTVYSDHMFVVDHHNGEWLKPHITPFQNISMSPATAALHYGQTIFEGLKAYKVNGNILLFRPDAHAKRMNISAKRLCMPQIPEDLFIEGLTKLLELDQAWIPDDEGCALYIRPMLYASDEFIRVRPSQDYKFIIFTSPVSGYYKGSVKVYVETEYVRAAEGGIGFAKSGGNYAASLLPTKIAAEKGYQQILWTDSKEHKYFEESGTMNVMFQINDTIVTPPLSTSILSGITRDSFITLAKNQGVKIQERRVSVDEILEAHNSGTLKDAFGIGTAATITHISTIHYKGKDIELPDLASRNVSTKLANDLNNIRLGKAEDKFGWIKTIKL